MRVFSAEVSPVPCGMLPLLMREVMLLLGRGHVALGRELAGVLVAGVALGGEKFGRSSPRCRWCRWCHRHRRCRRPCRRRSTTRAAAGAAARAAAVPPPAPPPVPAPAQVWPVTGTQLRPMTAWVVESMMFAQRWLAPQVVLVQSEPQKSPK